MGIVVATHLKTIGPCIVEHQTVAFADLGNGAVGGKSVRFANVAYNGIWMSGSIRIADIFYAVIGFVEHGPDQVVESAVHSGENGIAVLFHHVDLRDKIATFAYQELSGLEPGFKFALVGLLSLFSTSATFCPNNGTSVPVSPSL